MQSRASEREAEVREVLENYNNLERECASAQQGVATELRVAAQRLREDWAELRAARAPRLEVHRGSADSSPAGKSLTVHTLSPYSLTQINRLLGLPVYLQKCNLKNNCILPFHIITISSLTHLRHLFDTDSRRCAAAVRSPQLRARVS